MGFDPLLNALKSLNQNARRREASRIWAAIQNPELRKPIGMQQGMFGWGSNTFGQSAALQNQLREQDQERNELFGSAKALSILSGEARADLGNKPLQQARMDALSDTDREGNPRLRRGPARRFRDFRPFRRGF